MCHKTVSGTRNPTRLSALSKSKLEDLRRLEEGCDLRGVVCHIRLLVCCTSHGRESTSSDDGWALHWESGVSRNLSEEISQYAQGNTRRSPEGHACSAVGGLAWQRVMWTAGHTLLRRQLLDQSWGGETRKARRGWADTKSILITLQSTMQASEANR